MFIKELSIRLFIDGLVKGSVIPSMASIRSESQQVLLPSQKKKIKICSKKIDSLPFIRKKVGPHQEHSTRYVVLSCQYIGVQMNYFIK